MPTIWSFRYYVGRGDRDELREKVDGASAQLRARLTSRLRILATLPFGEWNENLYKPLHGECAGLAELRFKADNVQQRPLGFRSGNQEFTILFWAIEKGWKFAPANACQRALERKTEALADRSVTNAIWFALD
jgi:hypothetical protein